MHVCQQQQQQPAALTSEQVASSQSGATSRGFSPALNPRGAEAVATTIAAAAAAAAAVARATAACEQMNPPFGDSATCEGVERSASRAAQDREPGECAGPCTGAGALALELQAKATAAPLAYQSQGAPADVSAGGRGLQSQGQAAPQAGAQQRKQQLGVVPNVVQRRLSRVCFSFTSMEEDPSQLSLVAGDLVRVQCRDPSGWTYGRLDCVGGPNAIARASCVGNAGWFPDAVLGHDETLDMAEEVEEPVAMSVGSATTSSTRSRSQKGSHSSRSTVVDKLDGDIQDADRAYDNGSAYAQYGGHSDRLPQPRDNIWKPNVEEIPTPEPQGDPRLNKSEKRLAECARSRQRYMGVKENADRGVVEAEMVVESAERAYRAIEEQERKCRSEASCIAGCSSTSMQRGWQSKLSLLEAKKDVAAQNLKTAHDRLQAEKESAAIARRRLRSEQQVALVAMDVVTRQRGCTQLRSNPASFSGAATPQPGGAGQNLSVGSRAQPSGPLRQTMGPRAASTSSLTSAPAGGGAAAAERQRSPSAGRQVFATSDRLRQRTVAARLTPTTTPRTASAARTRPVGNAPSSARGRHSTMGPAVGYSSMASSPVRGNSPVRSTGTGRGAAPPPKVAGCSFAFGSRSSTGRLERSASSSAPVRSRPGSRSQSQDRFEQQPWHATSGGTMGERTNSARATPAPPASAGVIPVAETEDHQRDALKSETIGKLRKEAHALGAHEDEVDNALDCDDPKAALIELIIKLDKASSGG